VIIPIASLASHHCLLQTLPQVARTFIELNDAVGYYSSPQTIPPSSSFSLYNQPIMLRYQLATVAYGNKPIKIFVGENETPNVVLALACLSRAARNVQEYVPMSSTPRHQPVSNQHVSFTYCHPAVNHVGEADVGEDVCPGCKSTSPPLLTALTIPDHSLAMMVSYLRVCRPIPPCCYTPTRLPNVGEMQEIIEQTGPNTSCRSISVTEQAACIRVLGEPCSVLTINNVETSIAASLVMQVLEGYFRRPPMPNDAPMWRAPVLLQASGYRVVVVGVEMWKQRKLYVPEKGLVDAEDLRTLVVLKPSTSITEEIRELAAGEGRSGRLEHLLPHMAMHRVSRYELQRWDRFELLFLEEPLSI
jgi:hypothetical protein